MVKLYFPGPGYIFGEEIPNKPCDNLNASDTPKDIDAQLQKVRESDPKLFNVILGRGVITR